MACQNSEPTPNTSWYCQYIPETNEGIEGPSERMCINLVLPSPSCITNIRCIMQSDAVRGEISLTCDAWQASNADGYLAVTAHWIKESSPGSWKLQSAIIGFTQMNTAHDGVRLGQAVYKICERLNIVEKVHSLFYSVISILIGLILGWTSHV